MKIRSLYIKKYKILKELSVNFENGTNVNVIVGKNGSGKTTLFEAVIHIFRELSFASSEKTLWKKYESIGLQFTIEYYCKDSVIKFWALDSEENGPEISFIVNDKRYKLNKANLRSPIGKENDFTLKPIFSYLPDHIVTYYSGESKRITSLFDTHLSEASSILQKGQDVPLRQFINIDTNSIRKILISLLIFSDSKSGIGKQLSLDEIDRIDVNFKEPWWYKGAKERFNKQVEINSEDAFSQFNPDFFYAEGEVGKFLDLLTKFSQKTLDSEKKHIKGLTIYPKDAMDFFFNEKEIEPSNSLDFFKMLDHTTHSDLIHSVKLEVKLDDTDSITEFENMSEGEHQKKLVLGLNELFKEKETLFLFDEPDTYLHPEWQRDLMGAIIDRSDNDHFLMTTHSPQVLSKLKSKNIFIIDNRKIFPIDSPTINRDTNSILEEIFDVSKRPKDIEEKIQKIFDLISKNELNEASPEIELLQESLDPKDPVFLKISATVKRKKLLGK